ncbi:hypothetical protein LPB87_16805 [Flavobacterium sp. EDS]|uniref:hypothetical protein n=1 Tax=Flavobacterium sp. EDS TaxID=2897328 RepID=UPI001E4A888D|nr:hypothetical protein [Flavobacterium sp. EDS]MCD0476060.1 hypothetical protein [Flavobacterium sp. EDS]
MKNTAILYFSFISFLFYSCKPLSVPKSYDYNYYIFNTATIKSFAPIVYNKNKNLLLKTDKAKYNFDPSFYKKQFDFIKNKDTMNIYCFCLDANNYYFKDLEFKKGSYFLNIQKKLTEIKGGDLIVSKKIKSIIFKDYYKNNDNIQQKDLLLNNMTFNVIDFSDSLNIQLVPMSFDEFRDNRFLPKTTNSGNNQ